jgi:hypothetical protein
MADKKIRLLVKAEVNKAIQDLNKTEKSTNKLALAARQAMKAFAGLASAAALGAVVKSSVQTSAQFETLETRLVALKGSVDEGRKSFDFFNKVAATTPFQLANVVEAGAQLEAFGADSTETLKAVSDLAAFMGTDIVDAANAFGRAFAGGAGAADVLRDRGVLMQVKLKTGFDDLSKMTLPQFQEALVNTLTDPEGNIAGATDLLSQTFSGLVSNFQDSVSQLQDSIGDILAPLMKNTIKILKDGVDSITESFRQLSETELETTIRRLKEIGSENEQVQKALSALEERSRKQRIDALSEELEGIGSLTELSESVIEQVDKRAKLETELLPLLEEQEALQSKTIFSGQIRNRQENQRLQELFRLIEAKQEEINQSEQDLVILNNQILTRKQYNDLIEEGATIIEGEKDNNEGILNIEQEITKSAQEQLKAQIQQGKISAQNAVELVKNLLIELSTMKIKNALQAKINAKKKEELATTQAIAATSAVGGGFFGFLGGLFQTGGSYVNRFQGGGSFNVNRRTILPTNPPAMVGDNASGMERIDITPLPAPPRANDRNINIYISAPLVDETVVDHIIPAIRRAEKLNL